MLNHLVENCSEIYKLKKWDSIYDRVNEYMKQIEEKEQALAKISNSSEKTRLQNEINEAKGKIADEVDAGLTTEIGSISKLTAQIQMKNIKVWPFNRK